MHVRSRSPNFDLPILIQRSMDNRKNKMKLKRANTTDSYSPIKNSPSPIKKIPIFKLLESPLIDKRSKLHIQ